MEHTEAVKMIEDYEILRDYAIKLEMQVDDLIQKSKIDAIITATKFNDWQDLEILYNLSVTLFSEIETQWGTPALDAWCEFMREFIKRRNAHEQIVSGHEVSAQVGSGQ